jgi:hypothetical protein
MLDLIDVAEAASRILTIAADVFHDGRPSSGGACLAFKRRPGPLPLSGRVCLSVGTVRPFSDKEQVFSDTFPASLPVAAVAPLP